MWMFIAGWWSGWVTLGIGFVVAARYLARRKHGSEHGIVTGPNSRVACGETVVAVLDGPDGRRVID